MEFLASLAIKALVGTSICGTITVGTIYKCDKTLLGFAKDDTHTETGSQGGDNSVKTGKDKEVEAKKEKNEEEEGADASDVTPINGDQTPTIDVAGASEKPQTLGTEGVDTAEVDKDETEEELTSTTDVSAGSNGAVGTQSEIPAKAPVAELKSVTDSEAPIS